jgi:hypothetical protein
LLVVQLLEQRQRLVLGNAAEVSKKVVLKFTIGEDDVVIVRIVEAKRLRNPVADAAL